MPLLIILTFILTGCSLSSAPSPSNETIQMLDNQQDTINQLNKKLDNLSKQQDTQEQSLENIKQKEASQKKGLELITTKDIEPYLTAVNKIFCKEPSGWSFGSSILFGENKNSYILTNKHVITSNSCETFIDLTDKKIDGKSYGAYYINSTNVSFKDDLDVIMMQIGSEMVASPAKENLNYKITNLRRCPAKLALNSPVAIVGFPVTTQFQEGYETSARTITNGVVSAYKHPYSVGIMNDNYFITAKVDSGNSGGAAFSKDEKGLCFMGIPTSLSIGNYETQGIVLNIHNIFEN